MQVNGIINLVEFRNKVQYQGISTTKKFLVRTNQGMFDNNIDNSQSGRPYW